MGKIGSSKGQNSGNESELIITSFSSKSIHLVERFALNFPYTANLFTNAERDARAFEPRGNNKKKGSKSTTLDSVSNGATTTTTTTAEAGSETSTVKGGGSKKPISAAAGDTDAASCKLKRSRIMRRTLFEAPIKPVNGVWEINEDEYRLASRTDWDDRIAVVNLSGCSALFFFRATGEPSVFHIQCGHETEDGREAADIVKQSLKGGEAPNRVTIAASSPERYDAVLKAIKCVFPSILPHQEVYPKADYKANERWRFEVTVPDTQLTRTLYVSDNPRQAQ